MTDAATALELRRLSDVVAEMADDHQYALKRLLAADDRKLGAVIVPLAGEIVGGDRFEPAALVAAAAARRDAVGTALLETIHEADLQDGDGRYRRLGRLFDRISGVAFDGYRVVRDGRAWRIVAVSGR